MLKNNISKIIRTLIDDGYDLFDERSAYLQINEDFNFVILRKNTINDIYFAIVINGEHENKFDFYNLEMFENFANSSKFKKIYLVNIFLMESDSKIQNEIENIFQIQDELKLKSVNVKIDFSNNNLVFEGVSDKVIKKTVGALKKVFTKNETTNDSKKITLKDILNSSSNYSLSHPASKDAYITFLLISINVLVYFYLSMNGGTDSPYNLIRYGGLSYYDIAFKNEYYRIFTTLFLNSGFFNFIFSLLYLYILGSISEKVFGSFFYTIIFFLSALTANFLSTFYVYANISNANMLTDYSSIIISLGPFVGIYGLVGALLAVFIIVKRPIENFSIYTVFLFIGLLFLDLMSYRLIFFQNLVAAIVGFILGFIIMKIKKISKNRMAT